MENLYFSKISNWDHNFTSVPNLSLTGPYNRYQTQEKWQQFLHIPEDSTSGTWSRERIYRMGGGLVIHTVIIPLALSFPVAGCSCRSWDKWLIKFFGSQSSMTHFFRVIIAWVIIKWGIITWEIIKYVMIGGLFWYDFILKTGWMAFFCSNDLWVIFQNHQKL